jgi:hypothetical protein
LEPLAVEILCETARHITMGVVNAIVTAIVNSPYETKKEQLRLTSR